MNNTTHIKLAHGGGGQLSEELIRGVILPILGGPQRPAALTDAAVMELSGRLAFTTDSYVVQPLEFPGGDIGKLAVCGTVNDLAVAGAVPAALSMALVLEEGFEIALLERLLASAASAARSAGVEVVTGDTKVVQRGGLDGMIINTSGVGRVLPGAELGFDGIRAGDKIILSGPLGEHGLAVMTKRKGLRLEGIVSDCAAIGGLTRPLVELFGPKLRFMRDPTRGGLACCLVDIAAGAGKDIEITEAALPESPAARAAAEMLGLDLLTVANEGKLAAVVAADVADEAVAALRRDKLAAMAAVIGTIGESSPSPMVELATRIGGRSVVRMPYGEELPRIC